MNVFEYAMKMEQDGRAYYLEHAETAEQPELKKILLELADDELKHYNIFKSMRDGGLPEYEEGSKTQILSTVKNVFEELKARNSDFNFGEEAKEVWVKARDIEKQAEQFYRAKALEVTIPEHKTMLNRIADEEHRHWVTMHNVIQFLDRPNHWLEDAEWSGLGE